ncbi:MAG: FAD-dependent oxidoreductase, partial [Firmicutes bacterium]|nr:FAD-dependent oxidoreductase [Bacillota bacterium]
VIGKALDISELFADGYEAVFIGSGAGLPRFLGVPGEDYIGVYSANEYLSRINLMRANLPEYDTPMKPAGRVCVVGGGNVAMDAARCALRVGAESVTIVYRRSMDELPARAEEVHHSMEEGIIFKLLTNPVAVLGDEKEHVRGMECVEMELGEPDESGRRRPVEKKGSNFELPCDTVIAAIGTDPNPLLRTATPELEVNRWGCLKVDDRLETTYPHVYAGGDAVTGAATVIEAMGAGKRTAKSILEQLGI